MSNPATPTQAHVTSPAAAVGRFDSEKEAARAYDAAAKKHFGEFAQVNFPEDAAEVEAVVEETAA